MCLQLELILTAATLCIAIIGVISGLFGMNLHNTHEDSYITFVLVRCILTSLMSQKGTDVSSLADALPKDSAWQSVKSPRLVRLSKCTQDPLTPVGQGECLHQHALWSIRASL